MLFDEPLTGFDPLVLNDIKQIIRELKDRGIIIIIPPATVYEKHKMFVIPVYHQSRKNHRIWATRKNSP